MSESYLDDKIAIKKIRDKSFIRKLSNQLNLDFFNIVGYNPDFQFYGSFEQNHYSVYAKKQFDSESKYNIEFKFSVHYLSRVDVLTRDDFNSSLTDSELDKVADDRRGLISIFIEYMGVRPHGDGIGTLLMKSFIKRIKDANKFEKIFLYPEDTRAENFWRKVGFRDMQENDLFDKACPDSYSAKMVYDL